jgi:exonuclease VII small subunit|tara:strand:+ start:60 stop:314 length:255 start_codon:yes stop_codon:yes gene_type:complete
MKDKNLPNDIKNKSLNELRELANSIIENLEKEKDLENSINKYQELIRLNNLIEKKFQTTSKKISQNTKEKISKLLINKDEKKIK